MGVRKRLTTYIDETLPRRPRVDALLQQAITHPLVTVVAGSGYGKTHAIALFLREADVRVIWMPVRKLDNIAVRFWRSLIKACRLELLALASDLEQMSYPRGPEEMDAFLQTFARETDEGPRVVWVVDDMQMLENSELRHFLQDVAEAGLDNCCLLLISNTKRDAYPDAKPQSGAAQLIDAQTLAFTMEETRALLSRHGAHVTHSMLEGAMHDTEGWPFALDVLAKNLARDPGVASGQLPVDATPIRALLGNQWFSPYDEDVRMLLTKLSLLDSFSLDIVGAIGGCDMQKAMEAISGNLFIYYDPSTRLYRFHRLYRQFIAGRQPLVGEEEAHRIYREAGEWFLMQRYLKEAVECFAQCGEFEQMLEALYTLPYHPMDENHVDFIQQYLSRLPEDFLITHPDAIIFKANVWLYSGRLNLAKTLLTEAAEILNGKPSSTAQQTLLAEVYLSLGEIALVENDPEAITYMDRARKGLPVGSLFRSSALMAVGNDSVFTLAGDGPGALDRQEKLFLRMNDYALTIYNGFGGGANYLYLAESALHTFQFNRAQEMVHQAVVTAQMHGQHDVLCNAWFLMARMATLHGNYREAREHLEHIRGYINEHGLVQLYALRDCAQAWLLLKIHDFPGVPQRVSSHSASLSDASASGRDIIMRTAFRLEKGDYYRALAMALHTHEQATPHAAWVVQINMLIMQAICYKKLEENGEAVQALKRAYDMSHANGIILPFIEAGTYMRTLIEMVRKQDRNAFDVRWLNSIQTKSTTYAKRLGAVANEHHQHTCMPPILQKMLTDRELVVLQYLAQGLTREEISDSMHISLNGVKKHITSIYSKLGAINRSDAIHIAAKMGLVG